MEMEGRRKRPKEVDGFNYKKPGKHYLPRLLPQCYRGNAIVHWTLPVMPRRPGWLDIGFHSTFREMLLHAAAREGLVCPVYCLMPDHIHLVWMGIRADSDQQNAMTFLRTCLKRSLGSFRFQHQAHDHVLRPKDTQPDIFPIACYYVLNNPVRAGLASNAREWPFSGTMVPGYPVLSPHEGTFWGTFWKLYASALEKGTAS